jgi:hypothetical protein
MVVEQVRSGRRAGEVAARLGIAPTTVFRRVDQDKIDRGELAGDAGVKVGTAADGPTTDRQAGGRAGHGQACFCLVREGALGAPKEIFPVVAALAKSRRT